MNVLIFFLAFCVWAVRSQLVVTVFTTVQITYTVSTQGKTATTILSSNYVLTSLSTLKVTAAMSTSSAAKPSTKAFPTIQKSNVSSSKRSTSSSLPLPTNYASTVTYHHNKHRLNHTLTPALSWNPSQAIIATEIASRCVFAHNM